MCQNCVKPEIYKYSRRYINTAGDLYRYISAAGDIISTAGDRYISTAEIIIISTAGDISGCIYISPAVLIYLRLYLLYLQLYLYISGCTYYISSCTYISPAVLIYLRLYLYISGCIYISPVLHNFDTNSAP